MRGEGTGSLHPGAQAALAPIWVGWEWGMMV